MRGKRSVQLVLYMSLPTISAARTWTMTESRGSMKTSGFSVAHRMEAGGSLFR